MKKTALIFIFILSFINNTDAQNLKWYYMDCGVMDINNCTMEEFDCLWGNAKKITNGGMITTGIGIFSIVLGGYLFNQYYSLGDSGSGIVMMVLVGLIVIPVGITVWITGAARKSKLRNTPNYDTFKLGSLKVSPAIGINQFNNTYNYGVTLSLNF